MRRIENYVPTTRFDAMVYGNAESMTVPYCIKNKIKMIKCDSVDGGKYKIFANDENLLYSNCGHVYKADKKSLIEATASVKISDLSFEDRFWILAYCYFNKIVVIKDKGYLKISFYETFQSLNDGSNLNSLGKKFRVMFKGIENVSYTGTRYDADGAVVEHNDLMNFNNVVRYFQSYSAKKSITNDRYFVEWH